MNHMSRIRDISELGIPDHLIGLSPFKSESEAIGWENELIELFSSCYQLFTPFPEYFRTRTLEHRLLRQLAPDYLGIHKRYRKGLEIGCGYGFKSIILARNFDSLLGIDIPVKFKGYVRGNFENSIAVAQEVGRQFGIKNTQFSAMWPTELQIENSSISLIFSEYVLEHIPDLVGGIREMYRVLEPGGLMIHVVPTTVDPVLTFIRSQLKFSPLRLCAALLHTLIRKRRGHRLTYHGLYVPPAHSEHLHEYSKQFDLNSLEGMAFPMLEAGFRIEKIISTREHNRVIFARKE